MEEVPGFPSRLNLSVRFVQMATQYRNRINFRKVLVESYSRTGMFARNKRDFPLRSVDQREFNRATRLGTCFLKYNRV